MKQQNEKKLNLGKETIQDLDIVLARDEQKRVKGGTANQGAGTTEVPFHC